MKAEAGWGAAALAVAAFLGINSGLGGKPAPAPQAPGENRVLGRQAANVEAKSDFERGPCGDLEGTIRTFLLAPNAQVAAPWSCYGTDPKNPEYLKNQKEAVTFQQRAGSLQFVIAILPDPLHTHFSLSFDREAEAIQQGAQDEGYFYDSSWLPWETDEKPLVLLADQDKADDEKKAREAQPGILLFRGKPENCDKPVTQGVWTSAEQPYCDGLAVFIVGEEPTNGVHKQQFKNAVDWITVLQQPGKNGPASPAKAVKILGPTFSGSLPSLAQLLADKDQFAETISLYAKAPDGKLSIYSGGITSNTLAVWFANRGADIGKVRFRSFQQDGDTLLDRYREYLRKGGIDVSHLAIISEDETAYGAYADDDPNSLCAPRRDEGETGPTCLYYPRDLSALRGAYQKQGVFGGATTSESEDAAQRQLASDLADPEGKEHDTIRNFSGDQTALSQEAVLKQIVSSLRVHESEYLVLRSSNPLDQLFLSHFLRLAYPQGRIVLEGSDLLLRRENGAAALSGIMTLTTYPLLPWEYHWTTDPGGMAFRHWHRVFAQEGSEGTYVAARFLLHTPRCVPADEEHFLPPACDGLSIPDYAPPFWALLDLQKRPDDAHRPVTWLSVLGRDGFWPVAALSDPQQPQLDPPKASTEGRCDCPEKSKAPAMQKLVHWLEGHLLGLWTMALNILARLWESIRLLGHSVLSAFTFWRDSSVAVGCRPPWPPMPVSMKVCLLTILLLALFHFHCCFRPSITVKPVHRAHFVRIRGNSHVALINFGSIVVASVPILLAWGYGAMSMSGEPIPHAWFYRVFGPLIWVVAGAAICANSWVESRYYLRKGKLPAEPEGLKAWLARLSRGLLHLARLWRKAVAVILRPFAYYVGFTMAMYIAMAFFLNKDLDDYNRIPTYWRSIHLTTGVSPLAPLLALLAGLYLWFWYSLQGLALFGEDRPRLPLDKLLRVEAKQSEPSRSLGTVKRFFRSPAPSRPETKLPSMSMSMCSDERTARPMESLCGPFTPLVCWVFAGSFLMVALIALLLAGGNPPIRSLGSMGYSIFFCLCLDLCISLLLANAWQMMRVWLRLRQLLLFLDRLPLRRTMKAMKGYSWGSVWKMGGSILDLRYKLLSRQLESLTHLQNTLKDGEIDGTPELTKQVEQSQAARAAFAGWFSKNWNDWRVRDLSKLEAFQKSVANTCGKVFSETLVSHWRQEKESQFLGETSKGGEDKDAGTVKPDATPGDPIFRAEELVCLIYLGFIQNILGRMRTLAMQILWLFVAVTVSVATYPFDPRPAISSTLFVLFLVLGTVIVIVYSQMHRDAILSYVTDTKPGELGMEFWFKLIGFGVGPALGLLATIFPELTGSLFSWLQPGLASIR